MTQQMTSTRRDRFWNSTLSELQEANRSPVSGYRHLPLMSLEEAVQSIDPFVPHLELHVKTAKDRCKQNTTLTINESAAIYLYTMPDCVFHNRLNKAFRSGNPYALEPWLAFLKLFTTALGKLPSCSIMLWRGVGDIAGSDFFQYDVHTWWSVNSCSPYIDVAGCFAGDKGTLFCINAIHGKDITAYSAINDEKEIVLMPGTCLRVKCMEPQADGRYIVRLEECTTIPKGKHVMLSYHSNSQKIVSEVYRILQDEHIPVWFEERRDLEHNIHKSMADGVEEAAIVCCFMTPKYEKSENCKLELQYAQKRRRTIIPCLLSDTKAWKFSDWLEQITAGLKRIDFDDIPESSIHSRARELIDRIQEQAPAPQYQPSRAFDRPSYLFELVKQKYQQNSRIERIMNPSKSFPIEKSYINLAIVKAEEQYKKETQLREAQPGNAIVGAFEEIYGMKTAIDVKNIFDTCETQEKQVLVFGRAGIGKSTFCRYIAYQWATNSYWSQYELLALIPLRRLTTNRYPSDKSYSLIDLIRKEVFQYDLSEKDDMLLKNQFDARKTLWILDGYDEIVQNVPPHLECLFEQLLKTPHHILTSRPYLNTLSYDVQMEITGFTDKNMEKYVQKFFDQMKDELDDALIKRQKLLHFLKSKSSIWGVAHIPINLELICSCWSNEDWLETEQLTITTLYSMMTEWLCRRYLRTQDDQILQLSKEEIDQRCQKELTFLESLAFNAMKNNTIILRPSLLKLALNEAKVSSQEHPNILNIGILKTFNKQGIGNRIEMNKDHYFIHLSFQEYFAARYLINALNGSSDQREIEFMKRQKYNQRYALLFIFASGLSGSNVKPCLNIFWDTILGEPVDLVGIRHIQLIISCIEETTNKSTIPRHIELLEWIAKCIKHSIITKNKTLCRYLSQSLQRAQSVTCDQIIIDACVKLLQHDDTDIKIEVLPFISELNISNPPSILLTLMINALGDESGNVRGNACLALGNIREKAATNEVIRKIVSALGDEKIYVRSSACEALGIIGENAATNEVISKLVSALGEENESVKWRACEALRKIGEKAATNEVIRKIVSTLGDENEYVRMSVCEVLGKIGVKAATDAVISKLVSALGDKDNCVRSFACEALGNIGEKAGTNEVISKLVSALGDENESVRMSVCEVLGKIGVKAATDAVISKLVSALGDEDNCVRSFACEALGNTGEKTATNEVISKLVSALGDKNESVRWRAYEALGKIGEKAATNEVISKLVSALGDEDESVRWRACEVLGKIGEKAATDAVINKLVSALGDENESVRWRACEVLGKIGEKAATDAVINKLVSALEDESECVRRSACEALGKIGEKAATAEVISKLVSALGDEKEYVSRSGCTALGKIGEKAATNEVISKLLSALGDENENVRAKACKALGNIGEKAATNEVISKLMLLINSDSPLVSFQAADAVGNILSSFTVITQLAPKIISDLCLCKYRSDCLRNVSEDQLINFFLTTQNPDWLPAVTELALLKRVAVTATENKIVVYDREEPLELYLPSSQLRQQLVEALTVEAKRLHLYFEMLSDAQNKS